MKHKNLAVLVLLLAGISFAQTGLMGGSDGIHQQNTKTLGQWHFTAGTGGNVALDPWAQTRGGVFYENGERIKMQDVKLSATGNFFASLGFSDRVDMGVAAEINYDRTDAQDIDEAAGSIRPGDIDLWLKVRAPFVNEESVFSLAGQMDVYMPTGETETGTRPRHAWFIKGRHETQPFTSDEVVIGATAITTVDLEKIDIPLRFNAAIGFMYASQGANTLVYNTGINWDMSYWITAFVEYSGEFRVENNGMPIDFFEDPMHVTPGLRLHLPQNLELVAGIDLSTRMMRVGYNREDELKDVEKYTIGYTDENGNVKRYGYTPGVTYALTGLISWTFGGEPRNYKSAGGDKPVIDTVQLSRTDTVYWVDTIVKAYTVVKNDTIVKYESYTVLDSMPDADNDGVSDDLDLCPNSPPGIVVNRKGCPRDFDGDGIPDYLDQCPNTNPGTSVDSTGCAVTFNLEGLEKGITFKSKSTALAKTSQKSLDELANLMIARITMGVEIQCYMDNFGKDGKAQSIAQSRAQSVVDYLVRKGVEANRLRVAGHVVDAPAKDPKSKKKAEPNCTVKLVTFTVSDENDGSKTAVNEKSAAAPEKAVEPAKKAESAK
ncbi:OmpA family protein [Fibrobacter sp. UWEL]|uniref:OmpA family protein n=1 Tax=Fibrobacter sp. UWEL TaxID=1896209 RepID=UPI000921DD2E|nr:OmpA family protein [Fibrobacter sp. UWEL]SHK29701.1 Thrombospondin type 3 repeat-containing protein [Fibrobacter sp. UWEL]